MNKYEFLERIETIWAKQADLQANLWAKQADLQANLQREQRQFLLDVLALPDFTPTSFAKENVIENVSQQENVIENVSQQEDNSQEEIDNIKVKKVCRKSRGVKEVEVKIDLGYYRKISNHYKKVEGGKGRHGIIGDACGLVAMAIFEGDKYKADLDEKEAKVGTINYELSKLIREYDLEVIKYAYKFLCEKYPDISNKDSGDYPDIAKKVLGLDEQGLEMLPIEPLILGKEIEGEEGDLIKKANEEKQLFLREVKPYETNWHKDVLDIPNKNLWEEGNYSRLETNEPTVKLTDKLTPIHYLDKYWREENVNHQYQTHYYLWGHNNPDTEWLAYRDDTVWTRLSEKMGKRGEFIDVNKEYETDEEVKDFISYHYKEAAKQLFEESGNFVIKKSDLVNPFWHLPTNLGKILTSELQKARHIILDKETFKKWTSKVRIEKNYLDQTNPVWKGNLVFLDDSLTVPGKAEYRSKKDLDFFESNYTLSEFHYLFPDILWGYAQMFRKIDFLKGDINALDPLPIDDKIASRILNHHNKMATYYADRILNNKSQFITQFLKSFFSKDHYYGMRVDKCCNTYTYPVDSPFFKNYGRKLRETEGEFIDYSDVIDVSITD